MCEYLQKNKNIEILQMKAEFLRDSHNNVWFVHAKDFEYRKCPNTQGLESLDDDLL